MISPAPSIRRLALRHPAATLFRELFASHPYAFWLDSALVTEGSRWSYLGAGDGEIVEYSTANGTQTVFDYLRSKIHGRRTDAPMPFRGGYIGYFGYELKADCGSPNRHRSLLPDAVLLRAERFLAIDHLECALYAVSVDDSGWMNEIEARIAAIPGGARSAAVHSKPAIPAESLPPEAYQSRVRDCLELIAAGESYELCLTNQLRFATGVRPLEYYENLRRLNPAPYAAYLAFGDLQIACSSPECFLRADAVGGVESRPIKGTLPRGASDEEDAHLRSQLAGDPRFRAENLMIVDLVRNDLGRVCKPGSVHVRRLMQVETYATVHQLVSAIHGQLRDDASVIDCLQAAFPGGSMTGAPKLRAMELLDRLEPCARGIYAGSIGWIGLDGAADLNIVIRTAVFQGGEVTIGTGGAIVADSSPEDEWREMRLKADVLLRAFGS